MDHITYAMARAIARREAVAELRRKGLRKYRDCSLRDLIELADQYMERHRAEIMWEVMRWQWRDAWQKVRAKGRLGNVD